MRPWGQQAQGWRPRTQGQRDRRPEEPPGIVPLVLLGDVAKRASDGLQAEHSWRAPRAEEGARLFSEAGLEQKANGCWGFSGRPSINADRHGAPGFGSNAGLLAHITRNSTNRCSLPTIKCSRDHHAGRAVPQQTAELSLRAEGRKDFGSALALFLHLAACISVPGAPFVSRQLSSS